LAEDLLALVRKLGLPDERILRISISMWRGDTDSETEPGGLVEIERMEPFAGQGLQRPPAGYARAIATWRQVREPMTPFLWPARRTDDAVGQEYQREYPAALSREPAQEAKQPAEPEADDRDRDQRGPAQGNALPAAKAAPVSFPCPDHDGAVAVGTLLCGECGYHWLTKRGIGKPAR
jgi:hypothetical protein